MVRRDSRQGAWRVQQIVSHFKTSKIRFLISYPCSAQINANVERIPNSRVVKYASEAQARQAFDAALDAGEVEKVTLVIDRTVMSRADFEAGN